MSVISSDEINNWKTIINVLHTKILADENNKNENKNNVEEFI